MPDEVVKPEPSANLEPISVPPEPVPVVPTVSEVPTMPSVAQEAPTGTATPSPAETVVSAPEPINQAPAPVAQTVTTAPFADPRSFLARALASIQFRKKAKLDKVLKLAAEKHSITNDQVEKLLHVSDATATRYLAQLVKEGRLKKIGKDGSSRYEPMNGSSGGN